MSALPSWALYDWSDVVDDLTFIPRNLNISKKTDFDDLPEKPQDQVRLSLFEVLCTNVDHGATNGRGRIQGQVQIFLNCQKKYTSEEIFLKSYPQSCL